MLDLIWGVISGIATIIGYAVMIGIVCVVLILRQQRKTTTRQSKYTCDN